VTEQVTTPAEPDAATGPDAVAEPGTPASPPRPRRFDPLRGGPRFWIAFVAAFGALVLVPLFPGYPRPAPDSAAASDETYLRGLAIWIVFFLTYLALTWMLFRRDPPERIRAWAAARIAGSSGRPRWSFVRSGVGLVVVYFSAALAVDAAAYVVRDAARIAPEISGPLQAMGAVIVILAWFVTHAVHAERYAALYYQENGGLDFPGDDEPDYWEFVYFSFAIGMTFGTTNVRATTGDFRRLMLPHKLLSFGFNTAILALVLAVLFQ
jgi:uncharacterized membrane protein